MFTLITIEGIKVKAKIIPEKQLISTWKTLTSRPFPKVKAFQLNGSDFNRVIQLRGCEDDERREMEEWGRVLSTKALTPAYSTSMNPQMLII